MVSIEDVAKRAGVSVATVSRALRGLPNVAPTTRLRVEAAARDLDYVSDPSASRLAAGRTRVLGIVVPRLDAWYAARLMAAAHGAWNDAGHELLALVVDDHSAKERFVRELPFRKRVDGLLLVDVPFTQQDISRLERAGVPIVAAGAGAPGLPSVGIDERAAARQLVDHVVGLGHHDVALLMGSDELPFAWSGARERRAGIEQALRAADVRVPAHRVVTTDWSLRDAAAGTERLLDASDAPPTAIVCFSDELAIAAMGVLRRRGLRVPHEVTVVGFDDHELALHLDLTTVHQPVDTVGRRAADLLLQQLSGPARGDADAATTTHDVLPTRLVVRGSSAPPPSGRGKVTHGDTAGIARHDDVVPTDRHHTNQPVESGSARV